MNLGDIEYKKGLVDEAIERAKRVTDRVERNLTNGRISQSARLRLHKSRF